MLILSRKLNESIVIDGRIIVKVVRVDGDAIKLGITAPADVPVHREEVYEEIRRHNREALTQRITSLPKLSTNGATHQARPHSNRWQDRRLNPDTERQSPKPDQV
jgi:carbon storage regulator